MRNEAAAAAQRYDEQRIEIADWLTRYIADMSAQHSGEAVIPKELTAVLDKLVGNARVGEYLSRVMSSETEWSNRDHRRLSYRDLRANAADNLPRRRRDPSHCDEVPPTIVSCVDDPGNRLVVDAHV